MPWIMPGPEYAGKVVFYDDFPYAYWEQFRGIEQLEPGALASLPPDVSLFPTYADVTDVIEQKITGIAMYESQIDRLFESPKAMAVTLASVCSWLFDIPAPTEGVHEL